MSSREDVVYLARSANRVRALELLSVEAHDRRALKAELDVSMATVNRILDGFEARGWIECDDERERRYRATVPGGLLSVAFGVLLAEADRAHDLAAVLRWLPVADLPFDPARLADATVTLPGEGNPIAPVHRVVERMRSAGQVRLLPVGYVAESLRANHDAVLGAGQSLEAVFGTRVLECITADPTATGYLSDLLEAGCAIYHYDGTVPYGVSEVDGRYAIGLVDEGGAPQALVETDDEVVGAWVRERFEAYRDAAERLDGSSWTTDAFRAATV